MNDSNGTLGQYPVTTALAVTALLALAILVAFRLLFGRISIEGGTR